MRLLSSFFLAPHLLSSFFSPSFLFCFFYNNTRKKNPFDKLKEQVILKMCIGKEKPFYKKPNKQIIMKNKNVSVDPTRSTDWRDSLLNGRKNVKRKYGLIFEFWKIRPKGGTVLLWSRHLLLFLFLNRENQVRTKNPNDSSMEKKRSAKTRFLGPGIRLPIGKVPHMR